MITSAHPNFAVRRLRSSTLSQDEILTLLPLADRRALAGEGIWSFDLARLTRLPAKRLQAIGRKVPLEATDDDIWQILDEHEARDLLLVCQVRRAFVQSGVPNWRTNRDWHNFSARGMALWRRADHLLLSYLRSLIIGQNTGFDARRWAA